MSYYPTWDNKYLEWVRYQYGQTLIAEWPLLARIRTWQQQILFLDPVVYDWQYIQAKSLVIGGAQDNLTPNYAELARHVSETIPNAELILYPGIGHNPHFEIPEQYHADTDSLPALRAVAASGGLSKCHILPNLSPDSGWTWTARAFMLGPFKQVDQTT